MTRHGIFSAPVVLCLWVQVDDSRTLQESLDAAIDEKDPYLNKVIRIMATRWVTKVAVSHSKRGLDRQHSRQSSTQGMCLVENF